MANYEVCVSAFPVSSTLNGEPRWWRANEAWRIAVPSYWRDWLWDSGSLTARLRELGGQKFTVRVVAQHWCRAMPSERVELGCERRPWSFVREVYLYCGKVPCVFARTVIPAATLRGGQRRLLHLGSKPLGELLFRDPKMERGQLEITCLMPGDTLYPRAHHQSNSTGVLWGRRCVFWLDQSPLLVNEFFLPNLLEMLDVVESSRRI